MALIKKNVLLCNKCNKEAEATANMTILDEDFYLCDECLERVIRWITTKPEPVEEIKPVVKKKITHERAKSYTQ